jgi:hypothetical protein
MLSVAVTFQDSLHDVYTLPLESRAGALMEQLAEDWSNQLPKEGTYRIQLTLHGTRVYPETRLISYQMYEAEVVPLDLFLLRKRGGCMEQVHLQTGECTPLTELSGSHRVQIRHHENVRYFYDTESILSDVELLPGDWIGPLDEK